VLSILIIGKDTAAAAARLSTSAAHGYLRLLSLEEDAAGVRPHLRTAARTALLFRCRALRLPQRAALFRAQTRLASACVFFCAWQTMKGIMAAKNNQQKR